MDGILICGGILLVMLLCRRNQHEGVGTHASVHHNAGGRPVAGSDEPGISTDTNRWTNPMYAYELDNMYHNTPVDPTYRDDSWSSSSSADSFSSCSSFDD